MRERLNKNDALYPLRTDSGFRLRNSYRKREWENSVWKLHAFGPWLYRGFLQGDERFSLNASIRSDPWLPVEQMYWTCYSGINYPYSFHRFLRAHEIAGPHLHRALHRGIGSINWGFPFDWWPQPLLQPSRECEEWMPEGYVRAGEGRVQGSKGQGSKLKTDVTVTMIGPQEITILPCLWFLLTNTAWRWELKLLFRFSCVI